MPKRLPSSALTVQPRLTAEQMSFSNTRRPLIEVHSEPDNPELRRPVIRRSLASGQPTGRVREQGSKEEHLQELLKILTSIIQSNTDTAKHVQELPEEAEHPASSPIYWISKWVDYSDKYGIGTTLVNIYLFL